jgi:DUF4097 and DUF4098 domain-containing protein YvlB
MKVKRKLDMNRYQSMLRDLEKMHEEGDVSEETYQEMKQKYQEKLEKLGEEIDKEGEEFEFEFEPDLSELEGLGERISAQVESKLSRVMDKVQKAMNNIPASFDIGESYTTEEVHEGEFDTNNVLIDFTTVNGRITVQGWDEPTYKVVVTKKVREISPEKAQEKLDRVPAMFEHRKNGKEVLEVTAQEGSHVSITAYLPQTAKGGMLSRNHDMVYDLDLQSVNGRISVAQLTTGNVNTETENGKIQVENVKADELRLDTENGKIILRDTELEKGTVTTENGSIDLTNSKGETITATTENGSIKGEITFQDAELQTENGSFRITPQEAGQYRIGTEMGSISIEVPRNIPYHVEAKTSMGKVAAASDLEISSQTKHHIVVESSTFEKAQEKLSIVAHTQMGSIKIK